MQNIVKVDYYNKNGKKKYKRKKKGLLILTVIVCAITLICVLHLMINVNPVIKKVSEEKIRALTNTAINNAASEVMTSVIDYSDIIQIDKDNEGKITLIQANTMLINVLARATTLKAQNSIATIGEQGIKIPLGSLSGMTFLAGRGPIITIRVLPVGTIQTKFTSDFIAAGINQTKHKINMLIQSEVTVVIPGMNRSIKTTTDVPITENIIVGEVPEVYLNSNSLDEMMNLIP